MGALLDLADNFFNKKITKITNASIEFLLALIEKKGGALALILERGDLEEISILYKKDVGGRVLCFFYEEPFSSSDLINYYEKINLASHQAVQHNLLDSQLLCVERGALNIKNITPSLSRQKHSIMGGTSFDSLLRFFRALNYSPQKSLSPGSFNIKGGLVDVCLWGRLKVYRISFLEDYTKIYEINSQTNQIQREIKGLNLEGIESFSSKCSLSDIIERGPVSVVRFINNTIYYKKIVGKHKTFNSSLQMVDFPLFSQKYQGHQKEVLSFPCERGFVYKQLLYIPRWFVFTKKGGRKSVAPKSPPTPFVLGGLYIHENFGYCEFVGLEVLEEQERLCLKFQDGKIKLDVSHIHKIFFYNHSINRPLSCLSRPGSWNKTKRAGERRAREYVKGLIKTYQTREKYLTNRLRVEDPLIASFVASFKHKDTEDQKNCWEDILKDFRSKKPLNRLICGDVGFGKTELAIRAAFVAALNNKQTVVLAPTTILANQLYECFSVRLNVFGVFTGVLSSASKNNKETVSRFINKNIDVVIGTSSVLFQPALLVSCGLFIIDEEHRFGVKDKEKILEINPSVDFLSLSATPIPRSLQLSLSNIRNLSLLVSPPQNRKPIISSFGVFSFRTIKACVLRELNRNGQIYIVDNSVNSLKSLSLYIKEAFPGVVVDTIFSSLGGKRVVSIMESFSSGHIKILLSTTIIESGIDVGTTNTIIINNAHLFGLSQLYQLRGRVGRSSSQAYAWFFVPKHHTLSSDASKRITAVLKHSALGVGFKISQADLEIRGSGSLFGYAQTGLGGVGFELYTKMLSLVALEIKQKKPSLDCFVDVFNIKIPTSLINEEGTRAAYYKAIYGARSLRELQNIREGILGNFGFFAKEFRLLFKNRKIGLLAEKRGVKEIILRNRSVRVVFSSERVEGVFDRVLSCVSAFFKKEGVSFKFINSHKDVIFQYTKTSKDDYILLCSFLKKLTFI